MNRIFLVISLWAATPTASAADNVRATETAFAQAFADRDANAFFAFIADDATFLSKGSTLTGKAEVVKAWSAYFKNAKAPMSWKPERVVTNAAGDLGLSTGPVVAANGNYIGEYSSIWQKQADGTWKIVFDGPGAPACPK